MDDAVPPERKVINLAQRKKERLAGEPQIEVRTPLPDHIHPNDIAYTIRSQLDQLINLVRFRRLQSAAQYERTIAEKRQVTESRAKEALEHKCEQVFAELNRTFKNLEKLELRINEMRALRIQAGLTW